MEYVAHTETENGYRLKIIADNDAESPRDWDNGAVMVCEHRRYNLGDDDGADLARDAVRSSRDYRPSWESDDNPKGLDLSEPNDLWNAIQRCSDIIACPLYLYDHSGITISMGRGGNPFSCPWDSGMVGFIFMTKDMILKNWMLPETTRLTPALKAKALDLMQGETETYDMFLTGDVYGYVVERLEPADPDDEDADLDDDREGEDVDSCWGMFGLDYATEEGRAVLKDYASREPQLALADAEA
jgi:hypothetical protein